MVASGSEATRSTGTSCETYEGLLSILAEEHATSTGQISVKAAATYLGYGRDMCSSDYWIEAEIFVLHYLYNPHLTLVYRTSTE